MNYITEPRNFNHLRQLTAFKLLSQGCKVPIKTWQGKDVKDKPEMQMTELMNYGFTMPLMSTNNLSFWASSIKPNLPWADDHFNERICGFPINPGKEWANWPGGKSADTFRDEQGMFNHNYMERYWPARKWPADVPSKSPDDCIVSYRTKTRGIRNDYGDLLDLVNEIVRNPHSNQHYFPIFHPEDVGIVKGGRKPCTLGYHITVRNKQLHCYYPMRACDFIRHWADDIYLTIRLMAWIIEQCIKLDRRWQHTGLGSFSMHCTSLHIFENDIELLKGELNETY